MTSVAVVVLNYNGEKLLDQFLPSVVEHSGDAEVVVVDNGSTDKSVSLIKNRFPTVTLLEFKKNHGYCGGYNLALAHLNHSIAVLLNSDVEVTKGWLDSPIKILESNPDVVAVQPKILSYLEKDKFEYAGAAGGFLDLMGYPFCRGRVFQTVEKDEGQYDDNIPIFWASGACLIIRREAYLKAGGLDEDFFAHMEEIDLCWRLLRSGHRIFSDGQSKVYHLGGGTLAVGSPRKTFFNFKNGLTILVKNLPTMELIVKLPVRLALDWVAALNFFLSGYGSSCLAVFKAHLYFIAGLGRDLRKRKKIKMGYELLPGLVYGKIIVFAYFLQGRKRFSDIKNPK